MDTPPSEESKKLIPILTALTLALVGGIVKELSINKEHTAARFLSGMIIAAFTGMLAYCICAHFAWDSYITAAITGASGYLGLPFLDVLAKMLKTKTTGI